MKKTTEDTNKKGGKKLNLSKPQKFWIGLLVVLIALSLIVVGLWLIKEEMFEKNEHFIISRVIIDLPPHPNGYWNTMEDTEKRIKTLCSELKIQHGVTNLFNLDPATARMKILHDHHEIQDVQVVPVLPDTISFKITERTPVINIGNGKYTGKTHRYVDSCGIVVSAEFYPGLEDLPKVKDFTDKSCDTFKFGDRIQNDGTMFLNALVCLLIEEGLQPLTAKLLKTPEFGTHIDVSLKKGSTKFNRIIFAYPTTIEEIRLKIMPGLQQVLDRQSGDGNATIRADINRQWIVEPTR